MVLKGAVKICLAGVSCVARLGEQRQIREIEIRDHEGALFNGGDCAASAQ